jgi:very-short-patch-repair endonuclease
METDEQCKKLSIVITHPEIAKEWHPTKNRKNRPEKFTKGSSKIIISWQCSKNKEHVWKSDVRKRTKSFDKEQKVNDCEICNSIITTHPEIAKEWHKKLNEEKIKEQFTYGSNEKVWWQCPEKIDHVSYSSIKNRGKNGCPCCKSDKISKVVPSNCLIVTDPEIAKEWYYSKNIIIGTNKFDSEIKFKTKLLPEDFSSGSNQKILWRCVNNKQHTWPATIKARTRVNNPTGCPLCEPKDSSEELRIYYELLLIFDDIQHEFAIRLDQKWKFDYYIPQLKLVIEYDGNKWHKAEVQNLRDIRKSKAIKDAGYEIIRIREQTKADPLKKININDVKINKGNAKKIKKSVNLVLEKLIKIFGEEKLNTIKPNTIQLINDYIKEVDEKNTVKFNEENNKRIKNKEKKKKRKRL